MNVRRQKQAGRYAKCCARATPNLYDASPGRRARSNMVIARHEGGIRNGHSMAARLWSSQSCLTDQEVKSLIAVAWPSMHGTIAMQAAHAPTPPPSAYCDSERLHVLSRLGMLRIICLPIWQMPTLRDRRASGARNRGLAGYPLARDAPWPSAGAGKVRGSQGGHGGLRACVRARARACTCVYVRVHAEPCHVHANAEPFTPA